MRLSEGTSLLSMPASMEVRELSVKDWLVDDAKEPGAGGSVLHILIGNKIVGSR